jgi:hypothetical protein
MPGDLGEHQLLSRPIGTHAVRGGECQPAPLTTLITDDSFVSPDDEIDPRDLAKDSVATADERSTLAAFLRYQRDTFQLKCAGLNATALAARSVEPSTLSLLGLVRHLADVERGWFRVVMAGQAAPARFSSADDRDGDLNGATGDPAMVSAAWDAWRDEVAFAEEFVATAPDLDVVGHDRWRGDTSLRWVLIHMVEEYARHNGHADLLRERIDGVVGQ